MYLTNIHRLYQKQTRTRKDAETYGWAGPAVSKSSALDTSRELRKRISAPAAYLLGSARTEHAGSATFAQSAVLVPSAAFSRGSGDM